MFLKNVILVDLKVQNEWRLNDWNEKKKKKKMKLKGLN